MKNKISNIGSWAFKALFGMSILALLFAACDKDEDVNGPITISKVYLEDANSSVPDREVTFVRLGQLIRIEGSGFTGLRKVYINGYSCYFNPTLLTDNSMLVSVSKDVPTIEADVAVRNTIRFANTAFETVYEIDVRSSAPTITKISNTLPIPGETITVTGTGLTEIYRVVFPGNIEVVDGITSDVDGEFFTVVMPDGVSEDGGSLLVEGSNGGAYSPAYFNFKKGVIMNFDGAGTQGYWGESESMIRLADLDSSLVGTPNASQGVYVPHRPTRITQFEPASFRCSEVWTAGNDIDDWRGQLSAFIPATTPLNEVAFQFDIYVPKAWEESGYLKICLVNGFNGGEWAGACYNYVPWIVDGEVVPFETTGWTTVTIPLNLIYKFSDAEYTFEDVLAFREAASYQNFGFYFENGDFTQDKVTGIEADNAIEYLSKATSVNVYTDNWRVVSTKVPVYSDFPEAE